MCGIFGFSIKDKSDYSTAQIGHLTKLLFMLSAKRGQDASGVLLQSGSYSQIFKTGGTPQRFIKSNVFKTAFSECLEQNSSELNLMGQCRLVMSGSVAQDSSNQPILTSRFIGLHNGVITKVEGTNVQLKTGLNVESDSHFYFNYFQERFKDERNISADILETHFSTIEGSYNFAIIDKATRKLILSSNSGSLFFYQSDSLFIFASEEIFLRKSLEVLGLTSQQSLITPIQPSSIKVFDLFSSVPSINPVFHKKTDKINELKRCKKCILPSTYPLIRFDNLGVCNFCTSFSEQQLYGEERLLRRLDKVRSNNAKQDCLVGLSGGRDSSYGIYLLKEKYGMNPLAYTFDWGLTTDVSRRNQAKVCGKLGLEHVIRTPNIESRRRHIRLNVDAFLKKPHLGMVPLFMAGDKDFYHYGRQLRQERNLSLTIFCTGHGIERQYFKTGFCGVDDSDGHNVRLYQFSLFNKIKLALFYASQYGKNPAYINESLLVSLRAFLYSFVDKDDFLYLFSFIPWDEKTVENTIRHEFNWESDTNYGENQWRMGDGQTAFINYIYYQVAGFSEFDNFRSNQVRSGLISRDEAINLARIDNIPKWQSLKSFGEVVGLNIDDVIKNINNIKTLY